MLFFPHFVQLLYNFYLSSNWKQLHNFDKIYTLETYMKAFPIIYSLTLLFWILLYLLLPMLLCPVLNDLELADLHRLSKLQTLSSSNYTEAFKADFFFIFC